ncbi:cryptochrome-1 [Schistocerca serialis cubense]|uniref:cryptochrome-1 n=1 Tax=Schistocerca serialis cubense TaxID=2023355 RepID=UPI00214EF9DD|nr:cryptochrome-1 [Schistocerca serialis cubense]
MAKGVAIHWFRKGLRIHDNPALLEAISACYNENLELCPVFILDPWIIQKLRVGPNRWRFLQQSLCDLDTNLRKIGTRLYVLRGTPEETFKDKFQEWKVKVITFEADIEPYARERDESVIKIAKTAGARVVQKVSHTLYDPEHIVQKNMGKPPLTYQKLLSLVDIIGPPEKPVNSPSKLSERITLNSVKIDDHNHCVPTLIELGVNEKLLKPTIFPGGESAALDRLNLKMKNKEWVCKFEKPNTSPNSLEPSTTVLSPYLKFGCLSARTFYYKLKEVIGTCPHTKPPVSLLGQLLWREFYYVVAAETPNFDKMVGNPICCQVPWNKNEEHLAAWAEGRTGYPFIDAIMIQLRTEGWIHHLSRHAVACFLTRGDLWISWEDGQKVFEELLLDADWALNAGNWMWLSASAFFHQFFRVYSPVAFGKKTDKLGEYIKKYVPVLRKYPPEYIYEPWKAPLSVQKQAGCVVGEDYPKRIVIHEDVYKINISKMSEAYKRWKGGKSKQEDKISNTVKNKKMKIT